MKVLHIIPAIGPRYGGPSQAIIEMCGALRKIGVEAEIVTTNANGPTRLDVPLGERTAVAGIPIYYFSYQLGEYKFSWSMTKWLKANLHTYDIAHLHSVFCFPTTIAGFFARRFNVPYIIRPAGILDPWSMRRQYLKKRLYVSLLERENLRCAFGFHFTTQEERDKAMTFTSQPRPFVISNGVTANCNITPCESRTLQEKFPHLAGKILVLFLSRIHPKKGLDLLIPAMAQVMNQHDNVVLILAGTGEDSYEREIRSMLKAYRLETKTYWLGFVQGESKRQLLRNAKVFVLPSYQENFGIAVVEAMAAGLPVVISDQVQIYREVAVADAGLVVPTKVERLVEALDQILRDPALAQQMGQNGRQLATQRYTWDAIAPQIVEVYEQMRQRG